VLYKAEKTRHVIDQGKFVVRPAMPGLNIPGHPDHGYGPLALIAESFMAPDTWITMHEHVQDEIISYVPQGIMGTTTTRRASFSRTRATRWS
jgi:quercetin 2,3-dioxygenase